MAMKIGLNIVIEREKVSNGCDIFIATSPDINVFVEGKTIDEAVANLREATELYLEEFPIEETSRSLLTTFEVAELVPA